MTTNPFPSADHEYGYTDRLLRQHMNVLTWERFTAFISGQTATVDEDNNPVYYESDVHRFLRSEGISFEQAPKAETVVVTVTACELHHQKYDVEVPKYPGDSDDKVFMRAIEAYRDGEGDTADRPSEYVEVADAYGMPEDECRDLCLMLGDKEIIVGVHDVEYAD